MQAINLSKLERVDLREIWVKEHEDFTPWLAENLHFLSDAIGMELEIEAVEKSVGCFRADIVAKDVDTGCWVLIENQLERTDHGHLGQLITYASGLKASTLIWIAYQFTDEHIAALDWLNSVTDDNIKFYGLQIELWKIDAAMAPKFNVVSKPNAWLKNSKEYKSDIAGSSESVRGRIFRFIQYQLQLGNTPTLTQIMTQCQCSRGSAIKYRRELLGNQCEPDEVHTDPDLVAIGD